MGREELWRQAYEWMQRYGDRMPDAQARARDRLIGQRPSYYVKPEPRRSLIDLIQPIGKPGVGRTRGLISRDDALKYIDHGPMPGLSASQTIDALERKLMSAFDKLPDSFSKQVGQLGTPLTRDDIMSSLNQLQDPVWLAEREKLDKELRDSLWKRLERRIKPQPQARYVDHDGEQHVTEILEDTDELCPCGATWRHDDCEHT